VEEMYIAEAAVKIMKDGEWKTLKLIRDQKSISERVIL
jgi:hypothetical protein